MAKFPHPENGMKVEKQKTQETRGASQSTTGMVEHLPGMHKALGSILNSGEKKQKQIKTTNQEL
jgi:hypothetical protein